jgi:hypothetical protein
MKRFGTVASAGYVWSPKMTLDRILDQNEREFVARCEAQGAVRLSHETNMAYYCRLLSEYAPL